MTGLHWHNYFDKITNEIHYNLPDFGLLRIFLPLLVSGRLLVAHFWIDLIISNKCQPAPSSGANICVVASAAIAVDSACIF